MRIIGLIAALGAIVGLVITEFFYRRRFSRANYHWMLLTSLAVLPGIALLNTTGVFMEETKTVGSCASCHVMRPFVNDMMDPDSRTLAARHYQNRWIPDQQCYACHISYGVHGALSAKLSVARHWLLYVLGSWEEPIRHRGAYPNTNCLACHQQAQRFARAAVHTAHRAELTTNKIACIRCHGAPHPLPNERKSAEEQS